MMEVGAAASSSRWRVKGHANIVCYSDWEISPVTQLQMLRLQERLIKTRLDRASG